MALGGTAVLGAASSTGLYWVLPAVGLVTRRAGVSSCRAQGHRLAVEHVLGMLAAGDDVATIVEG